MKYIRLKQSVKLTTLTFCATIFLCTFAPKLHAYASEMDAVLLQQRVEEEELRVKEQQEKEALKAQIAQTYTMEQKYTASSHISRFGYWCYRPTASSEQALPLVVFLHGMDGCGSDLNRLMKIESIPSYIAKGDIYPNAVVISPQCPSGKNWASLTTDVMELIEQVVVEQNIDRSRISITGCSLGGIGTYQVAMKNPDYFSAVVPVCGSVNAANCKVLTNTQVKIFHGTQDYGMGFSSKTAAQVIQQNGGNCELIMLQGEGHEIRHVYKDAEYDLINWMIEQQRTDIVTE